MILDHQDTLPLLPAVPSDATLRCSACAIPLNIPGDRLSDDWGGECRYCITKAVDEAVTFLSTVGAQQLELGLAEAALILKHEQEYEDVHNGSGRSEEMPSELKARHAEEWKQFERQYPQHDCRCA